jgi:hypothetical protein
MSARHVRTVAGLTLVTALAIASLGPDSRAATSVVATSQSPMHARAFGGRVVWAELSDPGWQLKTLEAGRPVDLPIAPFKSDGALDVGPGEDGRPALVFSRCERTAEGGTTGCDVFRYDFATRAETPVSTANTPGAIETLPSIFGRRMAFMRRVPGRTRPALYLAPTRGEGRAVRVARGGTLVTSVALAREGLFFVTRSQSRSGLRVETLHRVQRGRRTTLERRRSRFPFAAGHIGTPDVARGSVYFSVTVPAGNSRARSVLVRKQLRTGRRRVARAPASVAPPAGVEGIMPSGRAFLLETHAGEGNCFPSDPCQLLRATDLRWR